MGETLSFGLNRICLVKVSLNQQENFDLHARLMSNTCSDYYPRISLMLEHFRFLLKVSLLIVDFAP